MYYQYYQRHKDTGETCMKEAKYLVKDYNIHKYPPRDFPENYADLPLCTDHGVKWNEMQSNRDRSLRQMAVEIEQ